MTNVLPSVELNKWHRRFLKMAAEYASWSKDPSTKIGCVIVHPATRRVLSGGYNGFPRGIEDNDRLTDKETKYSLMVHGEANAIYNATRSGVSLQNADLYCHGLPTCSECAKTIIQVGITAVFCQIEKDMSDKWKDSWELSKSLYDEAAIACYLFDKNYDLIDQGSHFYAHRSTIFHTV